jgi:hypothetical protein
MFRMKAAWSHRGSLPPTFELRKFEKQAHLVIELSKCQKTLERMLGDVRDTLRSIGPPVLAESKTVFGLSFYPHRLPRKLAASPITK